MAGTRRRFIIGIDEVGRGPLAGPVVVCALLMPAELKLGRNGLRDSKKLTPSVRREWALYIKEHPRIKYALARVRPGTIDRTNITQAANAAALRAFTRLVTAHCLLPTAYSVYLDGGLYLGDGAWRHDPPSGSRVRTLVKGDERIRAVALASIAAKEHRDRFMVRSAARFPGYGFESHKGYGTKQHREAVARLGPSAAHRLTFLGKYISI